MPRLGRQRRKTVALGRNRSVTTATPLVRKRITLTNEPIDRASRWMGKRRRARRGVTPVVRGLPWTLTGWFRGRVIVNHEAVKRASQFRGHLSRSRRVGGRVTRGLRYAPTATPLVRKRVVVEVDQTARNWAARLGRGRRVRAKILRSAQVFAPVVVPGKILVQAQRARPKLRARARRDITWIRSRVAPFKPRQPLTVDRRPTRPRPRKRVVLHPPAAAPAALRPARAIYICQTRAHTPRHRPGRLIRSRVFAAGPVLVPPPFLEGTAAGSDLAGTMSATEFAATTSPTVAVGG